jgi:hypothetical protein
LHARKKVAKRARRTQPSSTSIRGGIRTRDLLLRRQTRYPLRYTDSAVGEMKDDQPEFYSALPRSLVG